MVDSSNNKTSYLVSSQLPEFVRRDHPRFIEFLEAYYKFLEQDGGMMYASKRFGDFFDIDTLYADYLGDLDKEGLGYLDKEEYHVINQELFNNFAKFIPKTPLADSVNILKHSKDFYRSKGSEKSIRFLTRILFNKDSKVHYPQNEILKASGGNWFIQKSLNIQNISVDNVANSIAFSRFANTTIRGATSNSTATVETVSPYYENGVLVTELTLTDVLKDFFDGEIITATIVDEGVFKTLSANVFSGSIIKTTVTSPGSGYVEGAAVPIIPIDENGLVVANGNLQFGFGGQVIIDKVSKKKLEGKIKSVEVVFPGAGYKIGDPLIFTGGEGTGAQANVYSVESDYFYHTAYYDIVGSTIDQVADLPIQNLVGDYAETQAYSFLNTIDVYSSNLDISTTGGVLTQTLTLSENLANSNVYFETGDFLFVQNTYQLITSSNVNYWSMTVDPGLPGNLANVSFTVIKKPNVNSVVANSMIYWTYGPCGPIISTAIINPGSGYLELPTVSVNPNTIIRSMGVLGRMDIVDPGLNYQVGDQITFDNTYGTYGYGANAEITVVAANGAIVEVHFIPVNGMLPGGYGYREDMLPTANIHTTTGNGAIINVSSILCDGAVLQSKSNVIGSIESLRVISRGLGYQNAPILDLSTQGDGTAQAYANIVTGIYTYPGRYLDQAGQPSSYYVLENRDYYQKFSYVVQIDESINNYRKAFNDLIHPMGTKLFGEYLFEDADLQSNNLVKIADSSVQPGVNTGNLIVSFDAAQYIEDHGETIQYYLYTTTDTTDYHADSTTLTVDVG